MAGQGGTPDNGSYVGCGPVSRKKKKKKLNYSANKNSGLPGSKIVKHNSIIELNELNGINIHTDNSDTCNLQQTCMKR